jgi:prepilin-type processing-associated H-X9-DG protein
MELLAAIAIIAVLAGLTVPAWMVFREKSDATACGRNLRSLHLGLSMYAADHNNILVEPTLPRWAGVPWMVALQPYLNLKISGPVVNKQLVCPSAGKYVTAGWQWWMSTYAANWCAVLDCSQQFPYISPSRKLNLQKKPSETLAFFDYVPMYRYPLGFENFQVSRRQEIFRHGGKMNSLFLDGHVQQISYPLPTNFNTVPWRSDF